MKNEIVRFRCSQEFKTQIEILADRENRTVSNYITNLLKKEIDGMKKAGKEILRKAESINELEVDLPTVEIGDIVVLGDVWDGEGSTPCDSYSYLLTNNGEDGEGNYDVWINYSFKFLADSVTADVNSGIQITDIELI